MSTRGKELDLILETAIYLQTESRRLAREECQRLGITATQLNVLKLLEEVGDLSLSELSKRIAAQNSTVTGIVDRMVEAGLVSREQSEEDRRVWRIRPTKRGLEIAAKVTIAPWDLVRGAVASLAPDEKHTLTKILTKLAAHVRQDLSKETQSWASRTKSSSRAR
jgi:MarR family transcriptional regulator, organic hydroperoxide resistance regulator